MNLKTPAQLNSSSIMLAEFGYPQGIA